MGNAVVMGSSYSNILDKMKLTSQLLMGNIVNWKNMVITCLLL